MLLAMKRTTLLLVPLALLAGQISAQTGGDPIVQIKDEGMNHSQVMQTLSYLSDVIGPRFTAGPNMKRANNWTKDKMTEWGLSNAHMWPGDRSVGTGRSSAFPPRPRRARIFP